MPKPLPRVPHVESPFVLRAELLTLIPFSMSTVDRLEAGGQFPKRIRLEPTSRVAWLRRELTGYLRHLAKRRQSAAKEDHVEAGNQELVARSKESGPTPEDQPANPDHQFAPASATSGENQMSEDNRGLLAPNQLVGNDQPEGQSFETKAMECTVKAGAAAVERSAHVSKKRLARRGRQ